MSEAGVLAVAARVWRGTVAHVPRDPFRVGAEALEGWADGAVAVDAGGRIVEVGAWDEVRARHPSSAVEDRRGAWLLPGFVDAHVHYPQVGVLGGLGLRLLDWLETRTWPHEVRFADAVFARSEARRFLELLARNGTTSALVFGAHQAVAMEAFFVEAAASGLRITAGLTVGDVGLPEELRTTPELAYAEASFLARRWHGLGRLRYAVTPRFSVSSSGALLAACGAVLRDVPGVWATSHLNETPEEIALVRARFPGAADYLATYEAAGLVGPRSVFAHDVHPTGSELARLAAAGAAIAHCPTSNHALGSGLFPLARHVEAGVRVALGTDVGAGASLSMCGEATAAYAGQMLLGAEGAPLGVAHLLWWATAAGARALGLDDRVGDLRPGRDADLVALRPPPGSTLEAALAHAADLPSALATLIALAREEAVEATWVAGDPVWERPVPGRPGVPS
ncbi:MAG: guanine deaminase [Trueperaceae bacterium]